MKAAKTVINTEFYVMLVPNIFPDTETKPCSIVVYKGASLSRLTIPQFQDKKDLLLFEFNVSAVKYPVFADQSHEIVSYFSDFAARITDLQKKLEEMPNQQCDIPSEFHEYNQSTEGQRQWHAWND